MRSRKKHYVHLVLSVVIIRAQRNELANYICQSETGRIENWAKAYTGNKTKLALEQTCALI